MKLNMIRQKNETEDLILSITKDCETLFHQTHTGAQETLEFKLTQPRETFSFKPSNDLSLDSKWMVGLSNLVVTNSIFNMTEENKKFEVYTDTFDEFSFAEWKVELEDFLSNSYFTPKHL